MLVPGRLGSESKSSYLRNDYTIIFVLDMGSTLYVAHLQEKLVEAGFDIDVDGVFGDETEKAVILYQRQHRILHDEPPGVVTYLMMQVLGPWTEDWGG